MQNNSTNEGTLLDKVKVPADLKSLSPDELKTLCQELREELVQTLSSVGGHFASSLGVVELTVALHYCLNTPEDRLVWDVGHQAYIHKILTGRREELAQIRKLGGISGFPKRDESDYDAFGVAHAGTSISAAAGMLEASEHEPCEERRAVAVIGDGAMTCGMAFEALNHMGQLHRNLIVVLNDNEMSISHNVGALSWAFSKAATNKFSTNARRHFKNFVEKGLIPRALYRMLDRAEEAAQGFFSTPAMLFESFGFRYIGPIDGHNLEQVIEAIENAKAQDGPVLIHALTVKGKGYEPAENDPIKYHGVGPFVAKDGSFIKKTPSKPTPPSYTDVFGKTLVELAKEDPRIIGITAAMPDGTGLKYLANDMPERYYDVGICEQHGVTFAAGLACEGLRPFCTIYSTFLQRAYDQVVHDVCIQSLPVIFAMDRAGVVGADGATHHGVFDISYLRCLPNMTIMAPKNEAELRDMMLTAAHYTEGPIAIRYPRGSGVGVDISAAPKLLEIGKGEILRESLTKEVLLIAYGQSVSQCMKAAKELETQGIDCTVINARFVKPIDEELFYREIKSHTFALSVEDHALQGGFGSAILEFMADTGLCLETPLVRLGIRDEFIQHGTQDELYELCGYDVAAIVEKVKGFKNLQRPAESRVNK